MQRLAASKILAVFYIVGVCIASTAQTTARPDNASDFQRALALMQQDHSEEALAVLVKLESQRPQLKGLQHAIGLACYRSGRLQKAQQAFLAAAQQDTDDLESVQMEGLVLYRLNRPAEAIPYLERVRQWMPNANTDANYVLGLCYLAAQRLDDARRSFAKQYGEAPDSPESYLLLGTMLMHINQPDAAGDQARKALQLSPRLPLAHFLVGEVALEKGNMEEAIADFETERQINPAYAPVYDRLADAYMHVDKLTEAEQALIKGISLDRTSTGPFILMGKVLLRRQDTQTAIMYLKHAETMDPGNKITHTLLAQAYHHAGQEEQASRENDLAAKANAASQPKPDPEN